MLQSKGKLEKIIVAEINKVITDKEKCLQIYEYVNRFYGVPMAMVSDYITLRNPLTEASEFLLFCIQEGLESVKCGDENVIESFFTPQEIETYSKAKYQADKLEFPIRIKAVEINKNQWIGKINVKTLMKLRKCQLINYNTNAQRTMQRIIKGDQEIYKIKLNYTAVNSIAKLFRENVYIPTPFTFNIPPESMADFSYDNKESELVINSIDHFDILDGYHRYIAACKVSDEDKDFDYPMEVRIVSFYDDKAKQFIYQEDQKTKMRKVDSDSMNMNSPGNIVAERLNESTLCNLKGSIGRNQSIINLPELAGLINYFYFNGIDKESTKARIIEVSRYLTNKFNFLTECDPKYLEEKYSYKQLCCIMYVFAHIEDSKMYEVINEVCKNLDKLENQKFYSKVPKKSAMKDIEKLIKDCDD